MSDKCLSDGVIFRCKLLNKEIDTRKFKDFPPECPLDEYSGEDEEQ